MKTTLIALAALFSIATGARAEKDVEVVNNASHPVPTTQIGTSSVNIANTPSVKVTSLPNVHLDGTPAVTIAGTPAVTISGTPTVALANGASVTLAGTPAVTIAAPQPFLLEAHVSVANGAGSGNGSITVPAGQRAVIEYVSIRGNMEAAKSDAAIIVTTRAAYGQSGYIAAPLSPALFGANASMQTKLYAEAGSTVLCIIYTNSQYDVDANCNISGYFVPTP